MNLIKAKTAGKLSFFLSGIGMAPWAAIMPYIKETLKLNELDYALVILCFGIGAVCGMPVTGILCKRFGITPVITIALAFLFVSVLCASSDYITPLFAVITVIVWGFSLGVVEVANNIHGTYFEELTHEHQLSGFHAWSNIGCIVSAIIFPCLLPLKMTPFEVAVIISLPGLLAILYCKKNLINTHGQRGETQKFDTAKADNSCSDSDNSVCYNSFLFGRTRLFILGIACMLMYLCEGMVYDWSGVYLSSHCFMPIELAALGYAVFETSVAFMRYLGDRIVTRIGSVKLLAAGSAISFVSLLLISFSDSSAAVIALLSVTGLALGNTVPVIFSNVGSHCGKNKAAAISIVGTTGYSGVLLGPAILGIFAQNFGLDTIFSLTAFLMLLMGALCVLTLKKH
ncbi:MAG: MFS transporter [Succinivibrio sp.]